MDWSAVLLSVKLASLSTIILLVLGLPFTFYLSQKKGALVSVIEAFLSLPLVLPPTVLGFYLLLVLSSFQLAFSFEGLLIASLIYGMPFALQPSLAAFQSLDRGYLENSWILGESYWRTFFRVALPLARNGILSGAIMAFTHALGEFGVVLMIGGNIPNVTRTLSIVLYDQVESFDYAAANRTGLFLLSVSLISLAIVGYLRRRQAVA